MKRHRTVTNNLFKKLLAVICITLTASTIPLVSLAQDAADFMNGSPPTSEALVSKSNWSRAPYNRWAYQHIREFTATIEISRGDGPVFPLPSNPKPIRDIPVKKIDGTPGLLTDWLDASYTDGFLVLHKGKILTEVTAQLFLHVEIDYGESKGNYRCSWTNRYQRPYIEICA